MQQDEKNLQALIRNDFRSFIHKVFLSLNPGQHYQSNWHIDYIAEHLEAARHGHIQRLIINMPPRALKSICVSVAWPAWILAQNPAERIMAASYAMSLSLKHSLDTRNIMQADWYRELFPDTQISRYQNEKYKFQTTEHGFRMATSIGGVATGEGGNFLIVDDPLNPNQAMQKLYRDYVNKWFDHTFATRLDDKHKGVMVLVMQRLHQHDLSGHLLEKGGWEHISLPALAPEMRTFSFADIQHTVQAGEPLHSERDDANMMQQLKKDIGSYAFEAQYQQNPVPEDGGIIKSEWLKRYHALPKKARIIQSWDTAIKAHANNDASVCMTIFEADNVSYVAHILKVRAEYPDLRKYMLAMAAEYKPDAILVEDKASGQQLLQDLKRETNLPLIATQAKGDKMSRISAASGAIEAGKILFPKEASWLADFEAELLAFPNVKHDDQVDTLSQYVQWNRYFANVSMSLRKL